MPPEDGVTAAYAFADRNLDADAAVGCLTSAPSRAEVIARIRLSEGEVFRIAANPHLAAPFRGEGSRGLTFASAGGAGATVTMTARLRPG